MTHSAAIDAALHRMAKRAYADHRAGRIAFREYRAITRSVRETLVDRDVADSGACPICGIADMLGGALPRCAACRANGGE